MKLLSLALAPILIIGFYINFRDKYEKEPIRILILGCFYGAVFAVPIVHTENFILRFMPLDFGKIQDALYNSFLVAALAEEGFKFLILIFIYWKNRNFNEKFDGIVYAVFVSLGFAMVENVLYVFNPDLGGMDTAISRAIISVPSHALFGIIMGYYFAISKFESGIKTILKGFLITFLIHGIYDFLLLMSFKYAFLLFLIFVLYLWIDGFKKIKKHVEDSPFKKVEK